VTGAGGARETDPEVWWRALGHALAQTGRAREIAAISVAGQQHGLVVLDGAGGRCARPSCGTTPSPPKTPAAWPRLRRGPWWAEKVGVVPVASFTASKWPG